MSAEAFVDTNVFIYHLDSTDARKHKLAERIVRDGLASGDACISAALYHHALDVQIRWRFGFCDSLIVAPALAAGCVRLKGAPRAAMRVQITGPQHHSLQTMAASYSGSLVSGL